MSVALDDAGCANWAERDYFEMPPACHAPPACACRCANPIPQQKLSGSAPGPARCPLPNVEQGPWGTRAGWEEERLPSRRGGHSPGSLHRGPPNSARSSLNASHPSAHRLINFLFVFQSFIFKLQSSLLSNKYSTIKAFFP